MRNFLPHKDKSDGAIVVRDEATAKLEIVAYDRIYKKYNDTEEEWNTRISDYIYEHYPTQATLSAQTRSPQRIKERAAMEADETLKQMPAQSC